MWHNCDLLEQCVVWSWANLTNKQNSNDQSINSNDTSHNDRNHWFHDQFWSRKQNIYLGRENKGDIPSFVNVHYEGDFIFFKVISPEYWSSSYSSTSSCCAIRSSHSSENHGRCRPHQPKKWGINWFFCHYDLAKFWASKEAYKLNAYEQVQITFVLDASDGLCAEPKIYIYVSHAQNAKIRENISIT